MAHWFHRNPLKATQFVKFELKGVLTTDATSKICSELRLRRDKLFDLFKNAGNDLADVEGDFNTYMALFYGFLFEITKSPSDGSPPNSKLIPLIRFKWSHSMLSGTSTEICDSWYEALSLILEMAMWLTKHAAWVAGKDEVRENEAKEVLNCLRKAAGMFEFVKSNMNRISGASAVEGSDFDERVLDAYRCSSCAEAQEVVVARAIELQHAPTLVSSLAAHTAELFDSADGHLSTLPDDVFARWRRYLKLKAHFYRAYAYAFLGDALLREDKCGEAVKACKQGVAEFQIAESFAEQYKTANGPGFRAKPDEHLFFRRIQPLLNRHLEKAERENGLIYHQKVPDDLPPLTTEATHGVAKPLPYELPAQSQSWNPVVYQAFNIGKATMPDFSKLKKSAEKLEAVKEEKVYQTDKDPKNDSGCQLM